MIIVSLLFTCCIRYIKIVAVACSILLCFCTGNGLFAQDTKLMYQVQKGDKAIGTFTVEEISQPTAATKIIKLETHIKTSFVMAITVDAKEESVFQNGILHYSSVFRKVNSDEKVNKRHRFYGGGYLVENGTKTDSVCCIKITYNLMNLYNTEPVNILKVYSDNHQKFLTIKKTEAHTYRVDIPDGSYNKYFYKDGKCIKAEIHQSLYTVTMILTQYSS